MGRRTTSTTKGGKFMNPTDQARKEARRRELKKNKKQRIAVRQAVIKTKDPQQLIKELEDLDDMELDPTSETHYNEKVIRDKRRKLLETLIRIVDFYFKEDAARGREFKLMIENYKLNRAKKEMYYESVRNAEMVEIGTIPLPDAPFETPHLSDIPLPGLKPQSILKKMPPGPPTGLPPTMRKGKTPPGPPPGPPPAKKVFGRGSKPDFSRSSMHATSSHGLSQRDEEDPYDPEEGPELLDKEARLNIPRDMEEDDEEFHHRDDDDATMRPAGDSDDEESYHSRKRSVRFADAGNDEVNISRSSSGVTPLQAMMLKMAGQSVPPAPPKRRSSDTDHDLEDDYDNHESGERHMEDEDDVESNRRSKPPGPPPGLPPGPPPGMPPGIIQRPSGILPPGPPPGRPPTMPPSINPRPDARMMGSLQEGEVRPAEHGMRAHGSIMQNPNILSAPPSLIHRPTEKDVEEAKAATITAKPKLTSNPKVDSTRFMPTSLRIRRETKVKAAKAPSDNQSSYSDKHRQEKKKKQGNTTADAAYDSFMKEMQGLL